MQKTLLLLALVLSSLFSKAIIEHFTVGYNDFTVITEDYEVYDSKGRVMKLYRDEQNYDLTNLFNFTLHDKTGTCGARSLEDGYFERKGNKITLYTLWNRQGRAYDVPYGARIMRYEVQRSGELKLLSSKLYVETARKSFDKESGMRFLWQTPKTNEEKAEFKAYIESVERKYKGTFVFGDEAKALINEVKAALNRKVKSVWKKSAALQ